MLDEDGNNMAQEKNKSKLKKGHLYGLYGILEEYLLKIGWNETLPWDGSNTDWSFQSN